MEITKGFGRFLERSEKFPEYTPTQIQTKTTGASSRI